MENSKANAINKVDQVNDLISSSPIIKGLIDGGLSMIPLIGTIISSSLDTRSFQLFEKNSRQFAEEVRKQINELDNTKIDRDFLESDEFTYILLETLSRNAHTYEKEKVIFFATVFVNSIILPKSQVPFKEGIIKVLDELSVDHIRILALIHQRTKSPTNDLPRNEGQVTASEISLDTGLNLERTMAYCDHMIRYGLLRDWSLGKFGYQRGNYAITGYGLELAEFLQKAA